MKEKKLYIKTIGCQMNIYDSDQMALRLQSIGYIQTDIIEHADLVVLNTCSIRDKAETKAFSFIGRMNELKQKNNELIVAVGGCVAQQEGKKLLSKFPQVDLVFGTRTLHKLTHLIEYIQTHRKRIVDVDLKTAMEENLESCALATHSKACQFVTIMTGCDNFCSYCVVPHVRGRETSRNPEFILAEIKNLVANGAKEITLLGQNVNSYGNKENYGSFAQLLGRINMIDGIKRIRYTTSHPKDLSDELIEAYGKLDKLCKHIHLPVQSGSDKILKLMNRRYTSQMYLEKVLKLRETCPEIGIYSDFIVGFPGETDADFQATLDLIQKIEFDGVFAFTYSDRPNAKARHFDNKISLETKNSRLQALLDLQEQVTNIKNAKLVGTTQEILVEGPSKKQSKTDIIDDISQTQWTGRTDTNKIVNFYTDTQTDRDLTGQMMMIHIERALAHSLFGKPTHTTITPNHLKGESYAA